MKRTARSLLGAAALAPFAAALAVTAAPANAASAAHVNAARADAAPGSSTALLYDTAAAAYPATEALPAPVVRTAGRTAETATGAVDRTVGAAPGTSGLRAESARCKPNPGAGLPDALLPAVGRTSLGGLPKGDCLHSRGGALRTAALPGPDRAAGTLLRGADQIGGTLRHGELGRLPAARPALPGARSAGMPVGMALPAALPADLPSVPAALGFAQPGILPVSAMLLPERERRGTPAPSDDIVGQANDTVNKAGVKLDRAEGGVGKVVDVLKAGDRVAGHPADGPLSMPDASALDLPDLPGVG